jgi:osmotically-inducible protein OsmY
MRRIVLIIALLAGVMLYSCKPSDEKLQKAVETALTASTGVTSSVKDGVVTLTGTVESEEAKLAAETAAKAVKDIKSVTNNIQVVVPVVINPDETLLTSINSALSAAGFSGITVTSSNSEVTLTGEVKRADLAKVMQIANESKPAKVINQLKIK